MTISKRKAARVVRVKKLVLSPSKVLHVEVPAEIHPVVAVHHDPIRARSTVEIVPVPKKKLKWWQSVFGG